MFFAVLQVHPVLPPDATPSVAVQSVFAAAQTAQNSFRSGTVFVSLHSRLPQSGTDAHYEVGIDGDRSLSLRIQEPAGHGRDQSDRTYFVSGHRFEAFDRFARESLHRTISGKGLLTSRMAAAIGELPDPVMAVAQPGYLGNFLRTLRQIGGYRVKNDGQGVTVSRIVKGSRTSGHGSKGEFLTLLRFDRLHRLHILSIVSPNSRLDWELNYSPHRAQFLRPSGYQNVVSFTERPEPPQYGDANARQTVQKLIAAHARLRLARIQVTGTEGETSLLFGGGKYREQHPRKTWAFDGKVLSVRTAEGFYRGSVKRSDVLETVTDLVGSVDPLLRRVLARRIPFGDVLTGGVTVRQVGSMALGGHRCNILSATRPGLRISLVVDADDNLVQSVSTENLDTAGRTLFRSERKFAYSGLGKNPPAAAFLVSPRPGERARPLPTLSPRAAGV